MTVMLTVLADGMKLPPYLIRRLFQRNRCQLLVLDAFIGNFTPVIYAMNTFLLVMSGGMTSQLQFLIAEVYKPFEDYIKQLILNGSWQGNIF